RYELVAGAYHDLAWQHDCLDSHSAQLASGHEVRHSLPRLCARRLRHVWFKLTCAHACNRRLRLVRHTSLDRRRSVRHTLSSAHSALAYTLGWPTGWAYDDRVAALSALLGLERLYHISHDGFTANAGELGRAVRVVDDHALTELRV